MARVLRNVVFWLRVAVELLTLLLPWLEHVQKRWIERPE